MKNKKSPVIYAYLAICILFLFFLFRYIIADLYIKSYNKKEETTFQIRPLAILNINESYVYYYDLGIAQYNAGEYKEALNSFTRALKYGAPKKKDCNIRINLVLTKIALLDPKKDSTEYMLKELYECLDILYERGCALNYDSIPGHSQTAQQLRKEILELIEQLKNPPPESEEEDDAEEDPREQQLENIQKDSDSARESELNKKYDSMTDGGSFNYNTQNW